MRGCRDSYFVELYYHRSSELEKAAEDNVVLGNDVLVIPSTEVTEQLAPVYFTPPSIIHDPVSSPVGSHGLDLRSTV